uniref:Uncharacterized protein MANES_15G164100 n=1 Tax=Rhizophora mucronata TaxID=61149 RepID=A0A2P2MU96_RHIMU
MRFTIESTIAFLYSNPPSSLRILLKKFISDLYFKGNFKQRDLMASTTTILNSSAMSDIKFVICFIKRSTLDSFPVLSSVVIASVAILRF